MIINLLAKFTAIIGGILAIFTFGNFFGKRSQKIKQLKENFIDAIESKKRQNIRNNDNILAVRKRMQKYIRR
jgi:hypothetical protein